MRITDTIPTNSYQSEILKEYSKELPKQLELTRKNTRYPTSGIKKGTKDTKKSIGQEELCNGSSMDLLTMEVNRPNCIHPLPTKRSPYQMAFIDMYRGKTPEEVAKDEWMNDEATRCEIRDTPEAPPQTRLQAAQLGKTQFIPAKIEFHQQNNIVSITNLIDKAMALSQVSRQDISKSDNNGVIDITNDSE